MPEVRGEVVDGAQRPTFVSSNLLQPSHDLGVEPVRIDVLPVVLEAMRQ